MVETVDSAKLADLLEKKWQSMSMPEPLKILVQVNTSEEEGNRDSFSRYLRMV